MGLSAANIQDIGVCLQTLSSINSLITAEETKTLASGDRLLEPATIASINKTMTDASDTIDAIILASQLPPA